MGNSLLRRAVNWIGKLKWLLAAVAIYACLQGTSWFMFRKEMARMCALYSPVRGLNGAIAQWKLENRNQGQRVPALGELAGYMKQYRSIMGETMELPEQVGDSSRVVLPARLLTFPKGSKLSMTDGGLEVQRPGEPTEVWSRPERSGWIPFLWMVRGR